MSRRWTIASVAAFLTLVLGLTASLLGSRSGMLVLPEQMVLLRGGQITITATSINTCNDFDEVDCTNTRACYAASQPNCAGNSCSAACSRTDVNELYAVTGSTYVYRPTVVDPTGCGVYLNGATCQNYGATGCWCQGGVVPPPNQRVPCPQVNDTDFTPCS